MNKLATMLKESRRKGVSEGIELMGNIVLLVLNNVADEYMDEERISPFLKDVEAEINRVYSEVLGSVPSGEVHEMAEKVVYHVSDIRKRRGMDDRIV